MLRWTFICSLLPLLLFLATLRAEGIKRDYFAPLGSENEGHIRYTINTLAGRSAISLLFYRAELERRGEATGSVHPLNYLRFMFTDPELKQQVNRINRTVWRRFIAGFSESLQKAADRGNLTPEQIQDFANKTGLPVEKVEAMVDQRNWRNLMETLRMHVWQELQNGSNAGR